MGLYLHGRFKVSRVVESECMFVFRFQITYCISDPDWGSKLLDRRPHPIGCSLHNLPFDVKILNFSAACFSHNDATRRQDIKDNEDFKSARCGNSEALRTGKESKVLSLTH
jgi:hypothetical protein